MSNPSPWTFNPPGGTPMSNPMPWTFNPSGGTPMTSNLFGGTPKTPIFATTPMTFNPFDGTPITTPMDPVLYKSITSGDLRSLINLYLSDDILDKTTISKNTALHVAAQSGVFSSSAVICICCSSLVLKQNVNGDTPLHIAARDGRTEIVRLLIDSQHQDPVCELLRMQNYRRDTALHIAVKNNHFKAVKLLTEADPDISHNTLQAAILHNHSDIINLLIKKDLKAIREVDDRGWTVLHCAARMGNVSVIKEVTERYPDIWEAVDEDGCNFLHHAAWYNQIEVVKYVLANNATTNILLNGQTYKRGRGSENSDTPLHHAAYKKNKEIVLLLVSDKRVNLNIRNDKDLTALELTDKEDLVTQMDKAGVIHSRRRKEIMDKIKRKS